MHRPAAADDGLNGLGDSGLHIRPKGWENEVRKLRYARTDKDEAHEKPSERNAP